MPKIHKTNTTNVCAQLWTKAFEAGLRCCVTAADGRRGSRWLPPTHVPPRWLWKPRAKCKDPKRSPCWTPRLLGTFCGPNRRKLSFEKHRSQYLAMLGATRRTSRRRQDLSSDPGDGRASDVAFFEDADHATEGSHQLFSVPWDEPSFDVLRAETRRSACRMWRERKQSLLNQGNWWSAARETAATERSFILALCVALSVTLLVQVSKKLQSRCLCQTERHPREEGEHWTERRQKTFRLSVGALPEWHRCFGERHHFGAAQSSKPLSAFSDTFFFASWLTDTKHSTSSPHLSQQTNGERHVAQALSSKEGHENHICRTRISDRFPSEKTHKQIVNECGMMIQFTL